jgi:aspartate aminotransferase
MDVTPSALGEVRNVSLLASELRASEIIKLAGEIKAKIAAGSKIYNYTIGDFDPKIFPIPAALKEAIIKAYEEDQTNYPPSNGIEPLRNTLSAFIKKEQGLAYEPDAFLVAGGGRPLIYAAFQAMLDADEPALFPVPSWNNNHYTTLTNGRQIAVETTAEAHFMPTAAMLQPHIQEAGIVALCSPLNPTGTVFTEPALSEICDLIVAENERRKGIRKPLYLIYDQIYWQLCFGDTKHIDPVSINPAMRPYTIFIDGISKAYGATGVRVGWAFGPRHVIDKMKSILGHVGAWAPKPEQVGTSIFMSDEKVSGEFLKGFKSSIHERLDAFYKGFIEMKQAGLPVDAIAPKAAIYLTVKIDLTNRSTPEGTLIHSVEETTRYILDKAGLALVPFSAFGADKDSTWYRLSVGTVKTNDIPVVLDQLRKVIEPLN